MTSLEKAVNSGIRSVEKAVEKRIKTAIKNGTIDRGRRKDLGVEIPLDPQKFYEEIGLISHPHTHQPVKKLAPYQLKIWNDGFRYKRRLTIKSQKIGLSTSCLMEDLQRALLPIEHPLSCRGKQILIIAQSVPQAIEHLGTLRGLILRSPKYKHFLITKRSSGTIREEVSKREVLYIKNPDDLSKPTRIIARGPREPGLWSWREVKHIHMSDVAAINMIDDSGSFGAAMSRLINTRGTIHIETPPRGQRGKVWELYKRYGSGLHDELTQSEKSDGFHVQTIKVQEAIDAGVVAEEDIEREKELNPMLYGQLYECEFMNPYTSWYEEAMIKKDPELAKDYVST